MLRFVKYRIAAALPPPRFRQILPLFYGDFVLGFRPDVQPSPYSRSSVPSSSLNQRRSWFHTAQRLDASNDEERTVVLPDLSDFPKVAVPRFFLTLQNIVYSYIIGAYMDQEFDMKEFDRGARQALSIVSQKLADGNLDELDGLVDPETIAELRHSISTFSVFQRSLLSVKVEDIVFSFPYRIGVMLPDPPPQQPRSHDTAEPLPPQTRHVEITVVFHVLRNHLQRSKQPVNWTSLRAIENENRNNAMVCNYRFFRDFTKGVENQTWIINKLNHFLPAEHTNL